MTTKPKLLVNRHHKVAVREILSARLVYLWRNEPSKCIHVLTLTDRQTDTHTATNITFPHMLRLITSIIP